MVLLSVMTTGTLGFGRCGELLTVGFSVGHVNLGRKRDNDRLARAWITCSVTDATTAEMTYRRTEMEPLVGTNDGTGRRNRGLRFAADAGDDAIADVLLLNADPDDEHPLLEIYVKELIAPPYDQRKAVERLAYSPDEAAELLGISRELVHDLLRTGQLGSVKAGRRRLISKRYLEAFLAGEE
jgi:excisionase family DNA binding protein